MAVSSTYLFPPTTTGIFYNETRLNRLYVNGSLVYDDEFTSISMVADSAGRLGFQHFYFAWYFTRFTHSFEKYLKTYISTNFYIMFYAGLYTFWCMVSLVMICDGS